MAAALTISEVPELALVGYVYTKPAFRRCGLARATVLTYSGAFNARIRNICVANQD